jgi:hypothetical protein
MKAPRPRKRTPCAFYRLSIPAAARAAAQHTLSPAHVSAGLRGPESGRPKITLFLNNAFHPQTSRVLALVSFGALSTLHTRPIHALPTPRTMHMLAMNPTDSYPVPRRVKTVYDGISTATRLRRCFTMVTSWKECPFPTFDRRRV